MQTALATCVMVERIAQLAWAREEMMKRFGALLLVAVACAPLAAAAADRDLSCDLKFSARSWSVIYERVEGSGTVHCKDGSTMPVTISAKGLGITAGKWKITDGKGRFTHVNAIDDVLGEYLAVSGNVGVGKAGTAQVLTKGKVSLALAGKGDGFDIGVAVNDFLITKAGAKAKAKTK
jgi:hypothetical protein